MTEFLSTVLLIVGASFLLLAAFGLLRMPDLFMRMSSASKGTTLGVGCMLLAVGVHFPGFGITTRAIAGILFFFTTTPVAAHMTARAAYFIGVPLWKESVRDDLQGRYDLITHQLESSREELVPSAEVSRGRPTVVRIPRPQGPQLEDDDDQQPR